VIVRTGKCISSQSAATSLRLVVIHNKYPVLDAAEVKVKQFYHISIANIGHGADPGFLAVSPQVT